MLRGARVPLLAHWGDSLTAGTGSGAAGPYPKVVANSGLRGRWFFNGGVGGDTSTQVKTRFMAGDPGLAPATTIIWAGRNNYTSPATVKADIAAMIATLTHSRYLVLSIINGDYSNEYIGHTDYPTIITLNADLATLYGTRFVDVRTPLVAAGAPGGSSPSPTDYANDVPPVGIRFDNLHLLDAGYAIVAAAVYAKLLANSW